MSDKEIFIYACLNILLFLVGFGALYLALLLI